MQEEGVKLLSRVKTTGEIEEENTLRCQKCVLL